MAQVTVRINGYSYPLYCADGEEDHLRTLAEDLDQRVDHVRQAAGPSGEGRLLVMAALMLLDELHDLRPTDGLPVAPALAAKPDTKARKRLSRLARRAEEIADQTEVPLPVPATAPAAQHPAATESEVTASEALPLD